jgi:hypothetical protein
MDWLFDNNDADDNIEEDKKKRNKKKNKKGKKGNKSSGKISPQGSSTSTVSSTQWQKRKGEDDGPIHTEDLWEEYDLREFAWLDEDDDRVEGYLLEDSGDDSNDEDEFSDENVVYIPDVHGGGSVKAKAEGNSNRDISLKSKLKTTEIKLKGKLEAMKQAEGGQQSKGTAVDGLVV